MGSEHVRDILLVEDDGKLAAALQQGLEETGFQVTVARTIGRATEACAGGSFNAIVLDLGLPDGDGIDWLRGIRRDGVRSPVLILTARDSVDDRVLGLDSGADDYLAKPFAFNELLARLRALLRRTETPASNILQVGDLTVDLLNRTAQRGTVRLDLTPREFDVLAYLTSQAGLTVARDTLMRTVWKVQSRASSMDNVIDVLMARLREKVDKGFDRRLLFTVRGVGFKLQAEP